ncbi:unnamed protein product [Colias eurytheme]|nr:unnamed protein product [Colias eurytheme]
MGALREEKMQSSGSLNYSALRAKRERAFEVSKTVSGMGARCDCRLASDSQCRARLRSGRSCHAATARDSAQPKTHPINRSALREMLLISITFPM